MHFNSLARSPAVQPADMPPDATKTSKGSSFDGPAWLRRWLSAKRTKPSSSNGSDEKPPQKATSRWVRYLSDPTARVRSRLTQEGYQFLFLLMFSLIAAIIQNVNLLVLLAGSLAAMLLIQWRLCSRTIHRVTVQRNVPTVIEAGKPFSVELVIKNPKSWLGCWWLIVRETIRANKSNAVGASESKSLMINVERVLPKDLTTASFSCICEHRGEYTFRRSEISTRFPLSLMRGIRVLDNDSKFLVHPAFGKLDPHWREALQLPRIGEQQRRLPMSGGDGEFFGLRDYRAGDPMRLIHWRSSAKRSNLVVRQFERQENYEVAILLDLTEPQPSVEESKTSALRQEYRQRFIQAGETCHRLAITMIREILRQHSGDVNFAIADGKPAESFRVLSVAQLSAVLNRMAISNLNPKTQFAKVTENLLLTISPRNPIIVLSLRTREASKIDDLPVLKESSQRATNLRWINVLADDCKSYFTMEDDDDI